MQENLNPQTGKILVVDDEPSITKSLKRLLIPEGHEVFIANSGPEGLEILQQGQVDIIISDMRMPGMNGAEFLTQSISDCPEAQRILLTGYTDMSCTVEAIKHGRVHHYLNKPWQEEHLNNAIQTSLAHKAVLTENQELKNDLMGKSALVAELKQQLQTLNNATE